MSNSHLALIKQHWQVSLLVILFLPLFMRLGFWQLDRAKEKQQELAVYQQRQDLPVLPLSKLSNSEAVKYRTVELEGVYDASHYWLLDNQPRSGKTGYEVIMPLVSAEGVILINRGWVEASPRRESLPNIDTPVDRVIITGYLNTGQKNAIFDKTLSDLSIDWPKRVLQVNVEDAMGIIAKMKNNQYLLSDSSLMLRIDSASPGALRTEWPLINTKPEKHQGYAFQWFSMALALLALYIWFLYYSGNKEVVIKK